MISYSYFWLLLSKPQGSLDKNVTNSYVFAFAEGCDAWVKVGLNVVYCSRVEAFKKWMENAGEQQLLRYMRQSALR